MLGLSAATWELLAAAVTALGLPLAIATFALEKRRERENDEWEVYQALSTEYTEFLKLVMQHPDLGLFGYEPQAHTPSQRERVTVLYHILISLFERAYMLVYPPVNELQRRRWRSWEDHRDWCRRPDFVAALPELLRGEDEEFATHLRRLAAEEAGAGATLQE